jgi:competence/damage-inducible protein CinA-like protein
MPTAEIVTIGTEILLGDITDTNARYLARSLRDQGIELYRKTTIGDNASRIAQVIQECMQRAEIIITTGGLGPTVDDPTRQAIATALGIDLEYREELWKQIQERFRRYGRVPTENNKRQAYIPKGAIVIENPVGTAPAFFVEAGRNVICALPGVPREMEYLMEQTVIPYFRQKYNLHTIIRTRILHTTGVGESQVDDLIGDMEQLSNPTVGLLAHSGQVDVRITVKAETEDEAIHQIGSVEQELRTRLGNWIYGADEETLEQVVHAHLISKGWRLCAVEAGLHGELVRRLSYLPDLMMRGEVLPNPIAPETLEQEIKDFVIHNAVEVGIGVTIHPNQQQQDIHIALITPEGNHSSQYSFGGPPPYAPRWAVNLCCDLIRKV